MIEQEKTVKISRMLEAQEWINCPICDGSNFVTLVETDRYRMGIRTVECGGCGLIMTNPMPTSDALQNFYTHHYRTLYRKSEFPSVDEIKTSGMDIRAAHTAEFLAESRILDANSKVLDVGCGYGVILKAIGDRFPDAKRIGVEPGINSAIFARNHSRCDVYASISDPYIEAAKFDLIVVNHVLEHVRDPVLFLRALRRLTGRDGSIYIEVPDASRYGSLADIHIAHLYHFTVSTLTSVAMRAGLSISKIESYVPSHHPVSLRCVVKIDQCPDQGVSFPREREAALRLRKIGRYAWTYYVTTSRFARLFKVSCGAVTGFFCRMTRSSTSQHENPEPPRDEKQ